MIRILPMIGLAICLFCVCLLHPYFNGTNKLINYMHYFVYGNVIDIAVNDDLDIKKVKLIFKNESQLWLDKGHHLQSYHQSDVPMNVIIFDNGRQKLDIPYDYGKQTLEIFYDNVKVTEISHWQTLRLHSHRYQMAFYQKEGKISCIATISGPDVER